VHVESVMKHTIVDSPCFSLDASCTGPV